MGSLAQYGITSSKTPIFTGPIVSTTVADTDLFVMQK